MSDPYDATSVMGWCPRSPGGRGDDRLQLEVLLEALATELPTDAGGLVAAERSDEVHRVLVHAERAGAHPAAEVHALLDVGGPDRPGEAVLAVVGDAQRVLLV